MAKLDNIHAKLIEAARLLDEAAQEMRETAGQHSGQHSGQSGGMSIEQVSKIGTAMAEVMLVRHQIYIQRPDLMPGYLRDRDAKDSGAQDNGKDDK